MWTSTLRCLVKMVLLTAGALAQWQETCFITYIDGCAGDPALQGMMDDIPDAYQKLHVGIDESKCLARAHQIFEWCANEGHQQIAATFVPTGAEQVYPPSCANNRRRGEACFDDMRVIPGAEVGGGGGSNEDDARADTRDFDEDLSMYMEHEQHSIVYQDTSWNLPGASVVEHMRDATIANVGWWDYDLGSFHGPMVFNSTKAFRLINTWGIQEWYWDEQWPQYARDPSTFRVSLTGSSLADCPVVERDSGAHARGERHAYLSLLSLWNEYFQHIVFDTLPKLTFVCPFVSRLRDRTGRARTQLTILVHNDLQAELAKLYCPVLSEVRILPLHFGQALHASNILVPHFQGFDGALLYNGMAPPNSMRTLGRHDRPGSQVVAPKPETKNPKPKAQSPEPRAPHPTHQSLKRTMAPDPRCCISGDTQAPQGPWPTKRQCSTCCVTRLLMLSP
jgi:hypothetical protein